MKIKKIIALLCLFTLLLTAVACVDSPVDDENNVTTTSALGNVDEVTTVEGIVSTEEPTPETKPSAFELVKKEDFNNYEFRIYHMSADKCYYDFYAEDFNGDIQNDAIRERNLRVEEALNIRMTTEWGTNDEVQSTLRAQALSGDQTFDMYTMGRWGITLSYNGYLYDLASIEAIDLEREYWDKSWIETMTINDSLYSLSGDLGVSTLLFNSSLCFNKNIFDANGLEYPYGMVNNGTWTYDELYKLVSAYGGDLDNNGKMSYDTDSYGITGWGVESGFSLFYGSGFTFLKRNDAGDYTINFDAEQLADLTTKIVQLWCANNAYFNNEGTSAQHSFPFSVFSDGRALFCDIVLSKIGTFFSDMKDDYGIIPEPKFDVNQDKYYTYTGFTIPLDVVVRNCENPERTGTIMEALSAASYDSVTPQMLEIVTKLKNVRDADSSEMINLIIRNKLFDAAHWYDLPGFGSYGRTMIANKNTNSSSFTKIYIRSAENQMANILKTYEKLKNQ